MLRVDTYATDKYEDFSIRPGKPLPFGATLVPGGVNFSVYSRYATRCELVLFKKHEKEPYAIIPFPDSYRIGNTFTMVVFDLDIENIEYAYRMDGPNNFQQGHWFNKDKYLMDPYSKAVGGRDVWGEEPDWSDPYPFRSRIIPDDFDWEGEKPLEIPMRDLIIYEMHVRGFTRHRVHSLEDVEACFADYCFRDYIDYHCFNLKCFLVKEDYQTTISIEQRCRNNREWRP